MSNGSELLSALGLRDGNATVFVCEDARDGGAHWHAAQARTIRFDAGGNAVMGVTLLGVQGGGRSTEVGVAAVRVRQGRGGGGDKFKSVTALAQFAGRGRGGGHRFFVGQPDGSFLVAHNVTVTSSSSSSAAAAAAAAAPATCHISPGNAPFFAPFDISGEVEILSRVTRRPPALKSLVLEQWTSQGRRGVLGCRL